MFSPDSVMQSHLERFLAEPMAWKLQVFCVILCKDSPRKGQCLFITGEDFESESLRVPHGEAEGGMDVDSRLRPSRRVAIRLMVVEKTITSNYFWELSYETLGIYMIQLTTSPTD